MGGLTCPFGCVGAIVFTIARAAGTLRDVGDQLPILGEIRDMSDDNGYQWEFRCKRCGNGHRSPYQRNLAGEGVGLLKAASSLFGGKVSRASWTLDAYRAGDGHGGGRKDRHYAKAVEAVLPAFRDCTGCHTWVCAQQCWNEPAERCLQCVSADRTAPPSGRVTTRCGTCGAVGTGKFCSACGADRDATPACPRCNAKATAGAAFCSECGGPIPT
jgi:hypothetical protein